MTVATGKPVGRRAEDPERLKRRGSTVGRRKASVARKLRKPAPIVRKATRISKKALEAICRNGIPDYDPWANTDGFRWDYAKAKAAIAFFEQDLCHVKGARARTPFYLERWQKAFIGNLFGWVDPDGWRRYRECLLYVPRKSGKTPMVAGIILYLLFKGRDPGAEIVGAAAKYAQAGLAFAHARGMVAYNEELSARSQVFKGQSKAIQLNDDERNVDNFSAYTLISSENTEGHGTNLTAAVLDELHLQPTRDLVDNLRTATASKDRMEPLLVFVTTADFDREGSICNEIHDYAKRICSGVIVDPTFLPIVYEATMDDDWKSEAVWEKANPNIDVSVSRDYLRTECKRAQEVPSYENTFRRLHLNIRTAQDVRWLSLESWDACAGGTVDLSEFRHRSCYAGLDLATTRDLTALVMVFPEDDGTVTLLPVFWIPKETAIEREKKDRVPYAQWIREGWIRTTEGSVTDYATVRRDINALATESGIAFHEIAADRLFQGDQLCQELSEQDGFTVLAHGQGFLSMAAPTKRFEEMVLSGKLHHGGNPVLRWHASNVSVETDAAGNIKPSRKKSTEKIDGIVAAIMGVGRALSHQDNVCIYETRELLFV